jgi:hypothetical protein
MIDKVNSFTETVNQLVLQTNIALEFAAKTNEAITTQEDVVNMYIQQEDPVTGDASTVTFSVPSYNSVINKVNNALETVETFTKGQGKILLNDGTYREVKTIPIAISPPRINNVNPPVKFSSRNNWFFEDLMFPQLTVSFDLKGKIDDRSDRITVRRVIFDNFDDQQTQWFKDNIMGTERSYFSTIAFLNENNKKYWQDDQVHDLPIKTEPYTGYFTIIDKRTIKENNGESHEWYFLDTINFGIPSDGPVVKNIQLKKGNKLRFNNGIYKIDDIEVTEKRVRIVPIVGIEHPTIGKDFEIYTPPFANKIAEIPIGFDECNILFIKGINDDYNLLADEWSPSISFYTNDLTLKNNTTSLLDYYNMYVSDFGKKMEAEAKEKFIPAFLGVVPDAPPLRASAFKVSQINTQLNAALSTEDVKNTQVQIESTKTIINSLKSTIAQQKAELVTITDVSQREDLNSKIVRNTNELSKRTVEYQSLVRSLSTLAYESDAVNASPKYRLRGFFDVPPGKRRFSSSTEDPQEIIQFEVMYRYLKLDNTGTDLGTYTDEDPSTGKVKRGVFSDWNTMLSPIKERVYDSSAGKYIWVRPDIADGEKVNINQIDIPIRKGEKVEFKVRSISEAGWPINPVKSDWSNSIISEFPGNLSGSDQVTNILSDAVEEESTIKLEETLAASGIDSHIRDSIPNPNAGDGTYFKHQAVNLAFDLSKKDIDGTVTQTNTTDLQTQISNLAPNTYVTLTRPDGAGSGFNQVSGTLQKLLQAIVNIDPSIYDEFETLVNP